MVGHLLSNFRSLGSRKQGDSIANVPSVPLLHKWLLSHSLPALEWFQQSLRHLASTSSTAQGGGGSFKTRKPIGELGCCESGMAERSHWWTERCLRSPLFLSLSLTIYLPTYLSSMYLSICPSIYLSLFQITYLSIYPSISLSLSNYLSIYLSLSLSRSLSFFHLSICLAVYLSIYPSIYLSICLSVYLSICGAVSFSVM